MTVTPNERTLKNVINIVFLALSSFLIVYFLVQLTPSPIIKIGLGLFAVILEVFMQYLLATGRVRWKTNHKALACLLFFCYGLYVLVYAIPSATGFFMAEINAQEQTAYRQELIDTTNRNRLKQIGATIDNLNRQLQTEAATGYGSRSRDIMAEIRRLENEQAAIGATLSQKKTEEVPGAGDLFKVLAGVFGLPGNVFKIIIFGVSVVMVYIGLVMTSWDLNVTTVTDVTKRSLNRTKHLPNASEPSMDFTNCPVCGKQFTKRSGKIYCSTKCRASAWRKGVSHNEALQLQNIPRG